MAVYTVLLVDTAHADRSTVCGLAAVVVENGRVVHQYHQPVDPMTDFDPYNISQHGITVSRTRSAPDFLTIAPELLSVLGDTLVITADPFVRVGLSRAARAVGITIPSLDWIDFRQLAGDAWRGSSVPRRGSLRSIAERLQFQIRWHDPLNRALTFASVLETAFQAGGSPGTMRHTRHETVAFTGAFSAPIDTIRDLTIGSGMTVVTHVTPETTVVCIGGRDGSAQASRKTAERWQAEALIGEGHDICVVAEADFLGYLGVELDKCDDPSPVGPGGEAECDRTAGWALTRGRPLV